MSADNPLFEPGLPAFERIEAAHAEPAVRRCLAEYAALLQHLETLEGTPDFVTLVEAEVLADDALARVWSVVSHLNHVASTSDMRAAYGRCLEAIVAFYTARGQNRRLYDAYRRLAASEAFAHLTPAQRRVVEHELRDFRLAGVALDGDARRRFRDIGLELARLGETFSNHLLDATQDYSEQFDTAAPLAGLPPDELELLAGLALSADQSGYRVDLSWPAYSAIMTYADDRKLRRRIYQAHATRASDQGPRAGKHDNGPLVRRMLALRHEQAALLGFDDYAAMALETRMARGAGEVETFLTDLARRARPQALRQLDELTRFATECGGPGTLQPWDIPYYSEKLRERTLGISQEKLKPWFELERVFGGLFGVAGRLFDVTFERDAEVPVWHPDVRFYRMLDASGQDVAGLYVDLYSRRDKQGGAWMDTCRARLDTGRHRQQPVAYLNCNFAPPASGKPSLLVHSDVVTLFHEFGHCLHHLLTTVDWPPIGGICGVEWDAIELPSQLLEGWAWETESLAAFAHHLETAAPLPDDWLRALHADRQFQGALALVRQLQFALTDMAIHHRPGEDPDQVAQDIHARVGVTPLAEWNRYLNSFSHVFDGGYAAGYYSYLWAERLARDAFDVFRDEGLFNPVAGRRLAQEILAVGGSRPMNESWLAFRGRDAGLEALLQAYGIAA